MRRGGELGPVDEIGKGCGAVVHQGMQRLACYRAENGQLFRYSAICLHLQGVVRWNSLERTSDCPCHGSRFDRHGRVQVGPANADLKTAEAGTSNVS